MNDPDACLWHEVEEEIGLTPDVFVHYRDIGQGDDGVYEIAYSMNCYGEKECKISPLLTY
jgi:hypothetical protein